jgi:hypothetical protein
MTHQLMKRIWSSTIGNFLTFLLGFKLKLI